MKNWLSPESGLAARAIDVVPRTCGSLLNSAFSFLPRAAGAGALRTAGLRHEAFDHAMEHDAVVKSFAHQFLDPRDVAGRKIGTHLDRDGALGGFEDQSIFGVSHALFSVGLGEGFAVRGTGWRRPAGNRAAHAFGKWHRRAALQRLHHGDAVDQPVIIGGLFRFIGDPRMSEDFAVAVEAHDHGDVDAGLARDGGGGFQQVRNLANTSLMVLTCCRLGA